MSWKCDICDSYNEESSGQCYVCGQPRSAESIREGKLRKREERIARINAGIYKNAFSVSKVVFISGLAASIVIISIAIILKIATGQLDDIWNSLTVVVRRIVYNLSYSFGRNPPILFNRFLSGSFKNMAANAQVIWLVIGSNLAAFSNYAFEIIPTVAKKNATGSYNNRIVPISQHVSSNIGMLGAILTGLFSTMIESVNYLIRVVTGLLNSATRHFN